MTWDALNRVPAADEPFRLEPPFDVPADAGVADVVYERLLDALHHGRLQPGQRVSDKVLARQLGVSRTPVRESLLRLQAIGVVETDPGRSTRAAMVSREQTRQAVLVWATLYRLVISEVYPTATPELIAEMRTQADRYAEIRSAPGGLEDPLGREAVAANAAFYAAPVAASRNASLQRAVESVVHVVRLGGLALDRPPPPAHVINSHQALLAAAAAHDVAAGHRVLEGILGLDL